MGDEDISRSDARDVLLEQQIYVDQDFAEEYLESAWRQLSLRVRRIGAGAPFRVEGSSILREMDWTNAPAHSFMLTLSLSPQYSSWRKDFGEDYIEQGELFELVVVEAIQRLFPGWTVVRTGWSSDHAVELQSSQGIGSYAETSRNWDLTVS